MTPADKAIKSIYY